jgi:PAS domain S-box-containing protein
MGEFRNAVSSFRATPWQKPIGMFETVARKITSAGKFWSSLPSSSSPDPITGSASGKLLSALTENFPGFVWMKDLDGRYVYVNQRVRRLAPYHNGWLGKTDSELWPVNIATIFRENDLRVATTLETLETVEPCHFEGQDLWVLVHKFPIFDNSGAVVMIGGAGVDITERKFAEKALQETEQKYRSIFENAVEGIFQTTPEGRFVAANPALARMLGFDSPEELIRTRTDIAQEHYVDPHSREEFKRSMEENGFVLDFELEAYRKDLSRIWISENVRAVRDQSGKVVYYEGTTQDITARKQAEEALRESEERYRELVESSLDLICTHDLDGLILSANRAAMTLMGYKSQRYAGGTNVREILAPEVRDQFDDYLKRIRDEGFASGLMLVRTRTGERRIWEYHNTLRTQGVSEPVVRGMARDITERRRANHSLRLFRALLDRSSDAIEVIDPDTLRFLDCNKSAHQDLGYTREEFLSLSVYDIDPQVDQEMAERLSREIQRSGFVMFESVHRRKDGSTFPVEVNLKRVNLERAYRLAVVRDITERKMAEEALRQAGQKYRRIFENASEGIFQSTPDGKLIAANPALATICGFDSPQEMISACNDISQQTYVDPVRLKEFLTLIDQQGVVRDFEYQASHKSGRKIWISLNARAVRNEQGVITYYEGTAQDITDRKRAEDDLIKQKELLQKIVNHLPVMINFVGKDGKHELVNRQWEQTLGWTLEEIQNDGLDVFAQCYPDPQYRKEVSDFIAAATGEWIDFRTRIRDGSMIDTSWARIKLSDGTILGIGQDITARKRAEQAVRQAEQKYRELFENSKDATYVHDLNGRYISINRAAEKLSGYSREEILGKHFSGFVAPEYAEYVSENLCKKLRQEGETVYEIEVLTKDGRRVPVEVSSRLIYEDGVPVAVQGTARSIAERKRAEEALRGYSRQLIRAQETERQTIARELHDQIGQVLTAIRISLETIRKSSDTRNSKALIEESVTIVDEAIQQVRDLSFELRPSLLDDLGLTAAVRWYADRYTERTGIHTVMSVCPESRIRLPRELETACFRIVQEALTNVARHAQAKNVTIDVRTTKGALSLSIKDDGVGFDLPSHTNGEALNSLGLRGMEERAHGLEGKFEIMSAPGEGTEVKVHFANGSKRKESI